MPPMPTLKALLPICAMFAGVEVPVDPEIDNETLRVNILSSDSFHAADFAKNFGGGGHPKAAGLQLKNTSLDEGRPHDCRQGR
jgi:nanoRNase/pAp phosphatase (c-di-AMP/oligoRNAs hydrolase)